MLYLINLNSVSLQMTAFSFLVYALQCTSPFFHQIKTLQLSLESVLWQCICIKLHLHTDLAVYSISAHMLLICSYFWLHFISVTMTQ